MESRYKVKHPAPNRSRPRSVCKTFHATLTVVILLSIAIQILPISRDCFVSAEAGRLYGALWAYGEASLPAEPDADALPDATATPAEPDVDGLPDTTTTPTEPDTDVLPDVTATTTEPDTDALSDTTATPTEPDADGLPDATATPAEPDADGLPDTVAMLTEPNADGLESPPQAFSISGFLWVDGDGSLPTGWNGLCDGDEPPLAGYEVSLYAADDLTAPIDRKQTGMDGTYVFEDLTPGTYVVGLVSASVNATEYLLPMAVTDESVFAAVWDSEPPMAFSAIIEITEGTPVTAIGAGMRLAANIAPGSAYTIDVNDRDGSLSATGRGYTFSSDTLKFNEAAKDNHYTIVRSTVSPGPVKTIDFPVGSSPASVTLNGIYDLKKGITMAPDFSSDLTFNRVGSDYVEVWTALRFPADYKGILGINGLEVPDLYLPANYDLPLVFNDLIGTRNYSIPSPYLSIGARIHYPDDYRESITIGGTFFVDPDYQFPANYTGDIIIGDLGGSFSIPQRIDRPGAGRASDTIFVPNAISTLTVNNAKTVGSGQLLFELIKPSADFSLLLAGSSDINAYIRVPSSASLTIDSKEDPGSEAGRLAITTTSTYAAIGGNSSSAVESGAITINGGTLEARGNAAGIGGGSGQITINNGRVVATCTGYGAAIGSAAGSSSRSVAHITIHGGTVIATAAAHGAGIGSGQRATGSAPDDGISVGAIIEINGGTVEATSGNLDSIYLGAGSSSGAGIGGGEASSADITITGGHVTANSLHGAGVGNGAGIMVGNADRGSIAILAGSIRGYTNDGTNIGGGTGSSNFPTYKINKEADIMMYTRALNNSNPGNIICSGSNQGDGYFVSAFNFQTQLRGDIYVYNADTSAFVRHIPIPYRDVTYMSFLFSTGHAFREEFHIFADSFGAPPNYVYNGLRQFVHHYDHLPPLDGGGSSVHRINDPLIPSVTYMKSYPGNFDGDSNNVNSLIVCFGEGHGTGGTVYFKVIENYVFENGTPLPGVPGMETAESIVMGGAYSKTIPPREGYIVKGYTTGGPGASPPNGSGTYTTGNTNTTVAIGAVNTDAVVYFVYASDAGATETDVTISKVVTGDFANESKEFTFTVYFTDNADSKLSEGSTFAYEGGTVPDMVVTKPDDGILVLDEDGKASFSLKHGQAVTLKAVPSDSKVKIMETPDSNYTMSLQDSAYADSENGMDDFRTVGADARTFTFVNDRKSVEVIGLASDPSALALLALFGVLPVLSALAAINLMRRRKWTG